MSDETNSSASTPATNSTTNNAASADDAAAKAARFQQLKEALEEDSRECEALLISVRKDLADFPTNWPSITNQPSPAPAESSGLIQDLLNLFLVPVETFKRIVGASPGATPNPAPTNAPPSAPATHLPALPTPSTNGVNPPAVAPGTNQVAPSSIFLPQTNAPGASFTPQTPSAPAGSGDVVDANAASFVSAAGSQSIAQQIAAKNVRNALEENAQTSILIFNQLIGVIEGQNRALNELNQKILQLAGQINSLKNP